MKVRVSHPLLRDFFEQLRFSPVRQKKKQLVAAEHLMMIIEPDRDYPYDFVVFRITGFRPNVDPSQLLIDGQTLLRDLRVWISELSGELSLSAEEQPEDIFTVRELADRFGVSTKTIRRWQKRGLTGKVYVFSDGHKRLGFSERAVAEFEKQHPDLIAQAKQFSVPDSSEKEAIVQLAKQFAARRRYRTQNELVQEMVSQTGRARKTIQKILRESADADPDRTSLPRSRGKISGKDIAGLFKQYRQGVSVKALVEQFGRSRSSIYRIVNQQRAKEILARKIDYIPSDEYEAADAEERFLSVPLGSILDSAGESKLLNRTQEAELFRRYNFLKYLAVRERVDIQLARPRSGRLDRIESLLAQAEEVKQKIIEANMPLVASIAGKHISASVGMSELVSEGSVALMAAVEKFDYSRGYRFSTYASWAIAKDFARMIPAEAKRPDRAGGADFANVPENLRIEQLPDVRAVEQAQRDLRAIIENNLDQREQYIILNHYAIDADVIKKKPKTLKQIGDELNLSKERIRQIELQALQKLRQSLSPEQFDLLMG